MSETKWNNASGLSSSRSETFGVGSYARYSILDQGVVTSTGNAFDVALNTENAFFALNDGYGNIYYSRAGQFSQRAENGANYLVNGSGCYVQGFAANGDGTFSGTMSDVVIDPVDKMPAVPTTDMEIIANVPATGVESSSYGLTVYGPTAGGENMNMVFSKVEGKLNTWNIDFVAENGTITGGPIEAVSQGIRLADDDVAFRCNLVYASPDGVLRDYSAGHIENDTAAKLMADLQEKFGNDDVTFHSGVSYRNLLVLHGKKFSDKEVPSSHSFQ